MKILVVTQYFFPEDFKINDIAASLVRRGHSVFVVTGLPNYPEGEIFEGYDKKFDEDYRGVHVLRTRTRPRHTGSFNLFLNYLSFMIKAKRAIKTIKGNFDAVICFEPSPIFQLTPAVFAKKKFNCPLILICCDQWPESLKARGISGGPIFWAVSKYCVVMMNQCDHILNVSPSFIDYNHKINKVPLEKMSWHIQPCNDYGHQEEIKNKETVDLVFAGNIGFAQNVQDIVKAYSLLKYSNLKIHIYGDGSNKQDCEEMAKKEGVEDNVIFYGRVPHEELDKVFPNMDACLLTLTGKNGIGNTIPSKLISYFSTGKPVIAAINGDSRQIIEENKCGLCCCPDNHESLAELIDYFYKNKNNCYQFGRNARLFFDSNCTLDSFVDRLESIMRTLHTES